ncbi:MAG: FAD binding domain-containing protein [Vulcanimicrobiaceae bacterium]
MIPASFEYVRPKSLDEALALLAQHGDGAKVLAGGHSLIPMMKLRLAEPDVLVDIARLPGMAGIAYDAGHRRFTIGALTTHAVLAASADLHTHAPALWDAANMLGDPQVRNRGTIGGACAHGDPSADYPAVMLALGASFTVAGRNGKRELKAGEFFRGMFETALAPGEVLTTVTVDSHPHSAYEKLHHPASHYALVGVAARLGVENGKIHSAHVAITGVGDSAFRASGVEQALVGVSTSDAKALAAACTSAAAGIDARADIQGSAAYRKAMADVFTQRAVARAAAR